MNVFCRSTLHQIEVAIESIIGIMDGLKEEDLIMRPTPSKHSIGELLSHISLICMADDLIAGGASQEEMDSFYRSKSMHTLDDMRVELREDFHYLKKQVAAWTEDMLVEETTAYWGVTYTRFEWLVEVAAHLYHHRGQLHAMLVHCYDQDPQIPMFE
ncbi:DinB family protein [Rossellomorea vietnamensis]|uniref:Damage-inducible protein DinB n=1 Tax=Rossellomorea vietnamensis TaxID=218284 RepID=A0A0P6WQP4_9BACI|nr:DinB family protein [Rossellomorea vietnamensis]KPL58691.1 damage-inducible protein DinB [Rossellomorea vietnamensis]